jgi:hypothetical protein
MPSTVRKSPPACLWISIVRLMFARLKFSKTHTWQTLIMDDGEEYTVFRHIRMHPEKELVLPITFIVRFKFARLSYRANRIASIIPMLLITGYPGFQIKMYCVNRENGYWQGMYQWESERALDDYKRSFVFRVMNRRAIQGTVTTWDIPDQRLLDFIENHKI